MPSKLPEALVPVASGPNHDSSHSKPEFLALFCFVFLVSFDDAIIVDSCASSI
jgi:hypothetical protein